MYSAWKKVDPSQFQLTSLNVMWDSRKCDFNLFYERVLSPHLSGLILNVSFLFEILVRGMSHISILMCVR